MVDPILNSSSFHEDLRSGLGEAYVILWRKLSKRLIAYFIAHGFANEAEDLCSEIHLKLRRTLCASFDPAKSSFECWFFTVGKNMAIDLMRKREREVSLDVCLGLASPETSNEKKEGGSQYLKVLVRHAEALLRPNDRIILSLRVVEGLSFDLIAEELGISESAAAMRVSRALERLWIEMERLTLCELPRRIRRPTRRNPDRVVSPPYKKQKKSSGSL